ncbi:mitogen-activated protein kinase kinase [Novymonas esmeraldas]|uniref:mitogen-activated protein kinase kinase n=1 Tax=Novymonas esmeraldas TaxID=1808958 RepID=A0AAW0F621_9TRYP
MSRLKINLDAIERDVAGATEGFCADGVRIGSLLVSSDGLRDSHGNAYVLSLSDLEVVPEADGGFLGRGSSGSVRRALHRRSNTMVALKEIKVTGQAHISEIRRELETLHAGDVATPYLVSFYGAFAHEGSVFIAMEAMDGSLHELCKPVPPPVLASITRLMLKGLVYLHRTRHLIHRDLKPSNVLFNGRTGDIKISDFGVSSNLECTKADAHSFVGTVTYMSPERLRGEHYSYAADIWSLGLVVAELAVGVCPYAGLRGGSSEARFWALLQHLGGDGAALELPPDVDPDLAHFINACVAKAPERRPTCSALLGHPFIVKYAAAVAAETAPFASTATTPVAPPPATRFSPLTADRGAMPADSSSPSPTLLSPVRPHDGDVIADAADRATVAQWIHRAMGREARRKARAQGRDGGHRRSRVATSGSTAAEPGEGGRLIDPVTATEHDGEAAARPLRDVAREGSRDYLSSESGSASISHDCTSRSHPLACDDAMHAAAAEPSVNLDDELNKLLF